MLVKIGYNNGQVKDSILIEGETLKIIGQKTDIELEKRNWERKNC